MAENSHVRVVIDARLVSGYHGGVEQVIIGLAHGLSHLGGDDEYLFLCYQGHTAWLESYVSGTASIVAVRPPVTMRLARRLPWAAALRRKLKSRVSRDSGPPPVPPSDGTVESLGAEVVHFPRQNGFLTTIPSIFHPHDLQHVHFPDFFTAAELAQRDLWYRTLCDQASVVSVTSEWGKRDLIESLGVSADKIAVVPLAPALAAYESSGEAIDGRGWLTEQGIVRPFALYPAQTWPHKNHLRLLTAIARLREQGVEVDLVCTGAKNEYFDEIWRSVEQLGLAPHVRFLGYVSASELQVLYENARCLVMPTLFEAAGGFGPIAEAFLAGLPVACSNATSLPEQVGDAALVFDPFDESEIALAVRRLWTDADLRSLLVGRGRMNAARFSWERTARTFRAYYRQLAGRALGPEDDQILASAGEF